MERAQIIETVNEFLIEEFEADAADIVGGENMHDALDLDSLDYVDLVVLIDENFGFKTTSEDFQTIKTFDDFYDFISSKVNA
jgi:acyl carrier protein